MENNFHENKRLYYRYFNEQSLTNSTYITEGWLAPWPGPKSWAALVSPPLAVMYAV